MPPDSYQIRSCPACGLRYPLIDGNNFGTRCPACLGETRLVLRRKLATDPARDLPESFDREDVHLPWRAVPGKSAKKSLEDKGKKEEKEEREESPAVLMDNIRSAWNVGSIFRSADGFGFARAYLCGITPTPDGQAREAATKTSLGAEDSVTWSYHKDALKLVKELKKKGRKVWALEQDERAHPVGQIGNLTRNIVLIVGNEVTGVDPDLLDLCDKILYIPMRGEKKSFNVAVAFGIAAYALS